jgi:hypothetical protein
MRRCPTPLRSTPLLPFPHLPPPLPPLHRPSPSLRLRLPLPRDGIGWEGQARGPARSKLMRTQLPIIGARMCERVSALSCVHAMRHLCRRLACSPVCSSDFRRRRGCITRTRVGPAPHTCPRPLRVPFSRGCGVHTPRGAAGAMARGVQHGARATCPRGGCNTTRVARSSHVGAPLPPSVDPLQPVAARWRPVATGQPVCTQRSSRCTTCSLLPRSSSPSHTSRAARARPLPALQPHNTLPRSSRAPTRR